MSFIEENIELIDKMLKGEEGALEEFEDALAKDYVMNLDIQVGKNAELTIE
jgi:hypothetical protein